MKKKLAPFNLDNEDKVYNVTFKFPAPQKHLLLPSLTLVSRSLMKATGAAVHWSSSQQTMMQTGDLKKETSPLVLCKLSKSCTHGILQPC